MVDRTKDVLSQVSNIQEKGVAGAYDSQFVEIEEFLARAQSVLESNEGMDMLRQKMADIESKNQDGQTRLKDIYNSFGEINDNNEQQMDKLEEQMVSH